MAGVKQSAVPQGTMLCTSRDGIMAPERHEIVMNQQAIGDGWASLRGFRNGHLPTQSKSKSAVSSETGAIPMTNTQRILLSVLTLITVLAIAQMCAVAQTPVPPVANPCQRPAAGSVIKNPPAISSVNGVLN